MRISDWSSDVCSSDLPLAGTAARRNRGRGTPPRRPAAERMAVTPPAARRAGHRRSRHGVGQGGATHRAAPIFHRPDFPDPDPAGARPRAPLSLHPQPRPDRKSTRLNSVTNAHLVCRLLLEKKNTKTTTDK